LSQKLSEESADHKTTARQLDILELGTGSGLVAIVLGALLKEIHQYNAPLADPSDSPQKSSPVPFTTRILATDLPSALPLIERNLKSNANLLTVTPPIGQLKADLPIEFEAEGVDKAKEEGDVGSVKQDQRGSKTEAGSDVVRAMVLDWDSPIDEEVWPVDLRDKTDVQDNDLASGDMAGRKGFDLIA